jgi:hypothetical protein
MELAIDAILMHAAVFNPRLDPRLDMVHEDLRSALHALFDDLDRLAIDYLLVGGVALLSYVKGRNTQDIDLIIDPQDVARMPWTASLRDKSFGAARYRSVHVDFLLTSNPMFDFVRAHERTSFTFDGRVISTVTREGLVLLKLYALPSLYRQGEVARAALYETDILMLHQGVEIDDERLLNALRAHLGDDDVQELASILEEQRRRRRFDVSPRSDEGR